MSKWSVAKETVESVGQLAAENAADGMTKILARQLFSRHADTILGRRIPNYVLRSNPSLGTIV